MAGRDAARGRSRLSLWAFEQSADELKFAVHTLGPAGSCGAEKSRARSLWPAQAGDLRGDLFRARSRWPAQAGDLVRPRAALHHRRQPLSKPEGQISTCLPFYHLLLLARVTFLLTLIDPPLPHLTFWCLSACLDRPTGYEAKWQVLHRNVFHLVF